MAAASTKRYAEGNPLSVMDGIPVAVKEEFHVVRCNIVNGNKKYCSQDKFSLQASVREQNNELWGWVLTKRQEDIIICSLFEMLFSLFAALKLW